MKIFFQQDMPPRMSSQQRKRLESKQQKPFQVWMGNSRNSSKVVSASESIGRLNALQFTLSLISKNSLDAVPSLSSWILQVNNKYKRLEKKLAHTLEQMPPGIVKAFQDNLISEYRPQKGGAVAATLQKALIRYYR